MNEQRIKTDECMTHQEIEEWNANNEPADDEPCCWCNDQGPDTDDGESHPCAWCGAMS